ncbi:MAG TPA: hypothetical protein VFB72_05925 [Verrucomicrobiae bacterium]|nr:hypothetical protein [Verrucomicrobiae bacterium]
MNIEVTDEEQEILNEALQSAMTTLEVELHRTDNPAFKEKLKHRCDVLESLLNKVGEPVPGRES